MKIQMASLAAVIGLVISHASYATDSDTDYVYAIGSGYPYYAVLEMSNALSDNIRMYANTKIGLDIGLSAGVEYALDDNYRHAIGFQLGAVGVVTCPVDGCGSSVLDEDDGDRDDETINGGALIYSYNPSGLNDAGLQFRVVTGYGFGYDSQDKQWTGEAVVSYQF